jgi:D-beta-D-heptose 7-phosphate kinase/D-beta-D-heptose 1-phosphate adenosyltransferase
MNIIDFISLVEKKKPRISVVGDSIVDEYYQVQADRISPEFPIPVMTSSDSNSFKSLPGGAANVVRQFSHFNVDVKFFSLVGGYSKETFRDYDIDMSYCVEFDDQSVEVPIKRRFYDGDFPLSRWDVESENYSLSDSDLADHQNRVFDLLHNSNRGASKLVTVFSDYDKGVFSDIEGGFVPHRHGPGITIVDPKKGPIEKWVGCTVFKPNAKEALDLSGIYDWKEQCKWFQDTLGCESVVITQGGDGVKGLSGEDYFDVVGENSLVNSVIGAGDCFTAFLAMGISCGLSVIESSSIAYEAGSFYVSRKHNEPLSKFDFCGKFVNIEELNNRDFKLVFTNGCFDLVHRGHLDLLKYAKSLGDKLVVAVNSDSSVKKLKGDSRPINNLIDRMEVLSGLEVVDYVVSFDDITPYGVIKEISPDVLVKGADWSGNIVGSDLVSDVKEFKLVEKLSTTLIIDRIKKSS